MEFRVAGSASAHRASAFIALLTLSNAASSQVAGTAGIGASVPAQLGPFELRAGATVDRIGSSIAPRTTLTARSTIALPLGNGGFWLGADAFQAKEIDSIPMRPLFEAGLWRSFNDVTVRVGAATHTARIGGRPNTFRVFTHPTPRGDSITAVTGDSGSPSHALLWSDLETAASWTAGKYRLDAVLGARPAVDRVPLTLSGRFLGTMQINSRFALVAGVGTEPAQIALGVPASRFATLAVNVDPWRRTTPVDGPRASAAPFSVQPADAGRYQIAYRLQNAHRVEVSGDFDGWAPIDLTRSPSGVWVATIAIAPGTYHMNVRVDGGRWTAPPGTTEVDDEFSGTVGIVVVR